MVSLDSLEPEVVSLILEYVDDTSPRTTKAVACVNRYLNEITRYIAHRHKVLNLEGTIGCDQSRQLDRLIEGWINDKVVLANIRTLTVKGWFDDYIGMDESITGSDEDSDEDDDDYDDLLPRTPPADPTRWEATVRLISTIGKLRQLIWSLNYPIPVSVLDALEQHQKASTLRIYNFVRRTVDLDEPEPIVLRLSKSTALTHLRYAPRDYRTWPDYSEIAFRSIVASAPNLEYAGLVRRADIPHGNHQIEAAVERCKANFYTHDKPNTAVRQLTLDGVEISLQTLNDWSSTVDLSTIENVKFSRGMPTLDYFQHAATVLPNLKHLSLNLRFIRTSVDSPEKTKLLESVREYINTCSPLRTLSLWSWMSIVPLTDILQRHGPTLESLQLHEREEAAALSRDILSPDELKSIRTACPNLKDFTFDLNRFDIRLRRKKDIYRAYYEELTKMENLGSLQIYLDVGSAYAWRGNMHHVPPNDPPSSVSSDDETDDNSESTSAANDDVDGSNHNDNNQSNSSNQNNSSPPSCSSPPSKKRRIEANMRPSDDKYVEAYVKRVWKSVFGKKAGARHLDVKVGEWENRSHHSYQLIFKFLRHMVVRPHDRDDVKEPVVRINRVL